MQRLTALVGIVVAIIVIGLFFLTPWVVDYIGAGGDPNAGFGLQVVTALRENFNWEYAVYLLLPIGVFILAVQILFDAFIREQNHILMALAALILIISPIYFLLNFLAIPDVDPALGLESKWDFMRLTYWITLGLSVVMTIFGLVYAFFDWREYIARRQRQ